MAGRIKPDIHNDEKISFFEEEEKKVSFWGWLKSFFGKGEKEKLKNKEKKEALKKMGEIQENEKDKKNTDPQNSIKTEPLEKKEDKWSALSILSTNLIKGETTIFYDWGKYTRLLLLNIILTSLTVGFFYVGLLYWEMKGVEKQQVIDGDIGSLMVEISRLEKETEEVDLFYEKLAELKIVMGRHIYWDDFFIFFEKNILSDVSLPASFSGGVDGEYSFGATARDYKTMLDQVNYLRTLDEVLEATISNVSKDDGQSEEEEGGELGQGGAVKFSLTLKLDPNIFNKE